MFTKISLGNCAVALRGQWNWKFGYNLTGRF
jgi:hypothetical protein